MRDLNGDQEISAPARSRPLSRLTESLGGGALEGLGEAPEDGIASQASDSFAAVLLPRTGSRKAVHSQ